MISRNGFYFLIMLAAAQLGCSEAAKQPREITFDDRLKIVRNTETGKYQSAAFENKNGKDQKDSTKTLTDNSTLNTMFDGAGNKTETRFFDNHPLIKCLILRTSVRGERQTQVYAQNGDIKFLPENVLDKALSASANDLASAAGIYEPRKLNEESLTADRDDKSALEFIKPSVSYDFPPKSPETGFEKDESNQVKTENKKNTAPETLAPWIENDLKEQDQQ